MPSAPWSGLSAKLNSHGIAVLRGAPAFALEEEADVISRVSVQPEGRLQMPPVMCRPNVFVAAGRGCRWCIGASEPFLDIQSPALRAQRPRSRNLYEFPLAIP